MVVKVTPAPPLIGLAVCAQLSGGKDWNVKPDGNVLSTLIGSVPGLPAGFVNVKLSTVVPPGLILVGEKLALTVGGA
jgi:hypothetical protein